MKLYKIRDWKNLFENNRSRELKKIHWVVMPNKHDGENYSLIMRHEKAAEIFAGWVLILQIASKCTPRGTLIKSNGAAHSPHSLAAKSQAPAGWFILALSYLEENTDWFEVEELPEIPAPSCGIPAPRDEEGKGREGKEGKEPARPKVDGTEAGHSESPSWEEFREYCKIHGGPVEWYARDKFLAAQGDNWKGKERWTYYADRIRLWWENDGRPMSPPKSKLNRKRAEPTL